MTEHEPRLAMAEQTRTPEYLGRENIGLQARLLIGNFTDSSLTLNRSMFQPIQEHGAQGIDSHVATIYQKASFQQRLSYQEHTGLTYERWKKGFNKYLEKIRNDSDHPERKEFLETLGITESVSAEHFYNEYLRGKSDIIKFVDTVETMATRDQIRENESIIREIGNTFGFESSAVIDHLIHGVSNVKYNLDGFIKRAKRSMNTPGVLANPLFEKILEDSGEQEKPIVEKREPEEYEAPEVPKESLLTEEEQVPEPDYEEPVVASVPEHEEEVSVDQQLLEEGTARENEPIEEPQPAAQMEESVFSQMGKVPVWKDEEAISEEEEDEEEILLFPAPVLERKRDDSPMTAEEIRLAVQYLFFNDVNPHDQKMQARELKNSEAVKYYVRELKYMMEEYGQAFVLQRAGDAILFLQQDLVDVGLKSDKNSKSQSWYLWYAAKARFLANNPDIQQLHANADQYRPFDPILHYLVGTRSRDGMLSQQAEEDIMHAMLGWEVYRQRSKIDRVIFHLSPTMIPQEKRRLHELISEPPRDEDPQTLSAYKLREIGELVKKNKKRT